MTMIELWNGASVPRLGLGCWAIGGQFSIGGTASGWGEIDDAESARAIAAALELGIRFFDTAPAYGAGHSETVLGRALRSAPHAIISTKIGYRIDPEKREISETKDAGDIAETVEGSLKRLQRDSLDIVFLHLNECPIDDAKRIFDVLSGLREQGKVKSFGWSTDFPQRAAAMAGQKGFVAIQHAMNVFFRADKLTPIIELNGLYSVNRSPLAMGLLSGKLDENSRFGKDQIRGHTTGWMDYFKDGRPSPDHLRRLNAVRETLQSGGRTVLQGALCWLWSRSAKTLPIPGFRTEAQVREIAGALQFEPLPASAFDEIERLIQREPEGEPRSR
jgi:aryl-alcohol dehydrogenase-like predicted oxidoreductase